MVQKMFVFYGVYLLHFIKEKKTEESPQCPLRIVMYGIYAVFQSVCFGFLSSCPTFLRVTAGRGHVLGGMCPSGCYRLFCSSGTYKGEESTVDYFFFLCCVDDFSGALSSHEQCSFENHPGMYTKMY